MLIEELGARVAITDLVHTYALHVREGNGVQCVELFTEDAVFEVKEGFVTGDGNLRTRTKLAGRLAISEYLARTAAPAARVCPLIHNLLIRVDGLAATSTCMMTSLVWSSGQQLIGEYQDTYRYGDRWRFSSRIFTILGELPPQQPSLSQRPQS